MPIQAEDLTGRRFGRYTVLRRAENYISKSGSHQTRWHCRCDCGNERIVFTQSLKSGHSTSCGCYQKEIATSHGKKNTRLYGIWHNIKWRCYNPKSHEYLRYGGRGITVCDEWRNDFQSFYDWAMANGYEDNLSIDRIDNDGNYCPENCRWATAKEQANNRKGNNRITALGVTRTIAEWEKESGISRQAILWRISHGWSTNDAVSKEVRKLNGRN